MPSPRGASKSGRCSRDEWDAAVPLILLRAYTWLEDFEAVDREVAAALAIPSLAEPARLVAVRGAQALAWFDAGRLAEAAEAARAADADARRLGFEQHPFAVDYLRALAGAALERRDLDTAEHLTERALSISERGRPAYEFLDLLDRAGIWAARGQIRDALASVEAARHVLAGTRSVLLARADELEAVLRLSLGDLRSPAGLAAGLPAARRGLLLARVALAAGDHHAALEHLDAASLGNLTPRAALVRQILLAAAAIERGDPGAAGIVAGVLEAARHEGFLNTVVTTAPAGDPLPGRAFGAHAAGAVPGADHPRGPAGTRHAARRRTIRRHSRRAAQRRRAAGPEAAADHHLPADRRRPLHLAQHRQGPPPIDLPQARSLLTLRSHRASHRAPPDLRPPRVGKMSSGITACPRV